MKNGGFGKKYLRLTVGWYGYNRTGATVKVNTLNGVNTSTTVTDAFTPENSPDFAIKTPTLYGNTSTGINDRNRAIYVLS